MRLLSIFLKLQKARGKLRSEKKYQVNIDKEKAQAYYNKQNYYKAAKEFEQSAIYNPDDPITYYNIAQMYGATGDKKKEKANYTIFLQKSDLLKDTEENRELIKRVKKGLTRNSLCQEENQKNVEFRIWTAQLAVPEGRQSNQSALPII